MSNLCW